jgi:hypothetical protein
MVTPPFSYLLESAMADPIPCPFIYSNGTRCAGYVASIEAYKADLTWRFGGDAWEFSTSQPRSHYHVFCSEKGNHAGFNGEDRLKYYYDQLPAELQRVVRRP